MVWAEAITDRLLASPATLGRGRLLAIDGPSGSGKSTLARDVAAVLRAGGHSAAVLSLDDLYDGWTGLNDALERRILDQVVEPLATGRPARWQAYDWAAGSFRTWHDLAPSDVLVLEGCGSGTRLLAPYTTLLVWMEADETLRMERVLARDGPDVVEPLRSWATLERQLFAANDTKARADLLITT
jgi:uridine kinase